MNGLYLCVFALVSLLTACATDSVQPRSAEALNSAAVSHSTLCGYKVPLMLSPTDTASARQYVGIYGPGTWSNGFCAALIIESVGETQASVIFVNDKGWERFQANLYGDKIQFLHNSCNVVYQVESLGYLKGTYYGNRTFETSLSKRPLT